MTWSRLPFSQSPTLPEAFHVHLQNNSIRKFFQVVTEKSLTWWNFRDEAQLIDVEDLWCEAKLASGDVSLGRQDVLFSVFHYVIDDLAWSNRDFVFTADNWIMQLDLGWLWQLSTLTRPQACWRSSRRAGIFVYLAGDWIWSPWHSRASKSPRKELKFYRPSSPATACKMIYAIIKCSVRQPALQSRWEYFYEKLNFGPRSIRFCVS